MRQRTFYRKPFKAQIVQECLQPGVSMASVARRHGVNANLVRKWIPVYRDRQAPTLPAFVPMKLASPTEPAANTYQQRVAFRAEKTHRKVAILRS